MNQSDMRKLPPQSIEAEMSILGGILVDNEAINRARRALDEFIVVGIPTTIPFHQAVVEDERFREGEVYTDFVETRIYRGQA